MKVLVTGAAGFIGSHVVDHLVEAGADVIAVDALLPAAHREVPGYLNPRARFEHMDLQDEAALRPLLDGVDVVSHQAAMVGLGRSFQDVTDYVRNNDLATAVLLRALDAARFRGKLILASSMVVYGEGGYGCAEHGAVAAGPRDPTDLEKGIFEPACPRCSSILEPRAVTEADPPDPRNVYAATKLHQEHLFFAFGRETQVPVVALRYHNVYGPRMPQDSVYAGVASIFRSALESGRTPRVFEDGRQIRDFIHVTDVARANGTAIVSSATGVFNIATGEPTTIRQLAATLSDAFGAPEEPEITGEYRLGDVRHIFASPGRANRELGWRAEVSRDVGIKAFAHESLR